MNAAAFCLRTRDELASWSADEGWVRGARAVCELYADVEPNRFEAILVGLATGRSGSAIADGARWLVCVANLSPVPRQDYRLGFPRAGKWSEVLNTDSRYYGGSDVGNRGGVEARPGDRHGQRWSATVALPPLGVVWFVPDDVCAPPDAG